MILFIAVHAIKVAHIHEPSVIKPENAGKINFTKLSTSCAICDYDFAKNKDHFFNEVSILVKSNLLVHILQNIHKAPTSSGASSSDRGPPSLS